MSKEPSQKGWKGIRSKMECLERHWLCSKFQQLGVEQLPCLEHNKCSVFWKNVKAKKVKSKLFLKRASHFNDYDKGVHQENRIFLKQLKPKTDKNNTGTKIWLLIKKECQ